MVLLGIYLWLAALCAMKATTSPLLSNTMWLFRNSISPAAGIVTLVYWFILFPTIGHTSFVDVHCHLVNTMIVVLDIAISRLPYYLYHFHHSIAYLLIYLTFSLIYWGVGATDPWGHHYIYEPLDYQDNPLGAVVLILALMFIVFPILQLGLWRWWWYCERRWGGGCDHSSTSEGVASDTSASTLYDPLLNGDDKA